MLPLGFICETWAPSTRHCREICLGNTSVTANAIATYINSAGQRHLSLTSLAVSSELAPNHLGGLSIQLEGTHAVLMCSVCESPEDSSAFVAGHVRGGSLFEAAS